MITKLEFWVIKQIEIIDITDKNAGKRRIYNRFVGSILYYTKDFDQSLLCHGILSIQGEHGWEKRKISHFCQSPHISKREIFCPRILKMIFTIIYYIHISDFVNYNLIFRRLEK